jgi:hypothetical protein
MLPVAYERPIALLLVLGGALACVAGHRLFRIVLAIYGFILGAMMASSVMGITNTTGMLVAAVVGGLLGAFVAHAGYGYLRPGDPPVAVVIVLAVFGALVAMVLQRYVIVVVTAFAGAWTMIVGGLTLAGDSRVLRAATGDVWILYPLTAAAGRAWVPIAWIMLGLLGAGTQLGVTGKRR